ncbi:MAG TPA: response regulator transcription factor [Flavobacteriales bacterium]|nr:response regulator transcription factor [Flavobacteriales bacterium]
MKPKVLIVEDEVNLMELLIINLEDEGYECLSASNGKIALEMVQETVPDLVLLDVMLPLVNGFEVAAKLQTDYPKLPIIFLTARSDDKDKIKGLKAGAVDYIAKPFNLEELLLRVNIHLKNLQRVKPEKFLKIGDYQINVETYEILLHGKVIAETGKKEMQLLQLLVENAGKVVSRELIMSKIWGNEVDTTSRTIDNYILTLRKWFNEDPKNPRHFHSIRGVGYKLTP